MSAQQNSNLGQWLDKLFTNYLFQPDDTLADRVMEEDISSEMAFIANGKEFDYAGYIQGVKDVRAKNLVTLNKVEQLLVVPEEGSDGHAGSMAVLMEFSLKERASGETKMGKAIMNATVRLLDGKPKLVAIYEVVSDFTPA